MKIDVAYQSNANYWFSFPFPFYMNIQFKDNMLLSNPGRGLLTKLRMVQNNGWGMYHTLRHCNYITSRISRNRRKLLTQYSATKLLTKILADRLQAIIIQLLHRNQYGFIKNRTIQECIAQCFEYIHQCHQREKPYHYSETDFAKAFDTIEHSVIIQITSKVPVLTPRVNFKRTLNNT